MMAETVSFGQNTPFQPNKFISAEYSVSAKIWSFQTQLIFGFGTSAKNLFWLSTTDSC